MSTRDAFLARLSVARSEASQAIEAIDEIIATTVDPAEDTLGKERGHALEWVDEQLGSASRATQSAMGLFETLDYNEGEPDDYGDDEPGFDEEG